MNFKRHLDLEGKHAFLSPSNYHWLNYDPDKLRSVYTAMRLKEEGTKLHDLARRCIELGVMLPSTGETLNMYINDCIICRMTPEQPLYYSHNCYGTADAIGYDGQTLRIFDLKTGVTKAHINQLRIYAALFFLEYGPAFNCSPRDTEVELRIYQSGGIVCDMPQPNEIVEVMNKIIFLDDELNKIGGR